MAPFSKGVKLPKRQAALDVIEIPIPEKVIIPLKQYMGSPATPLVSEGDQVKTGQIIGRPQKEDSLPIFATITGKVARIKDHLTYKGEILASVEIQGEGTDTWEKNAGSEEDIGSFSGAELLQRIRQWGPTLKGPLPMPLAKDLLPEDQPKTHLYLTEKRVVKKIQTLLINALDPEPYLGINKYLSTIETPELPQGIAALKAITGAEKVVFAVDKNAPACPQLKEMAEKDEEELTFIAAVNGTRFPVGQTISLIKAVLGKEIPLPYGHPRDVGVAAYDLDTVISVGKAVTGKNPQVESLITVGGGASPRNGIARIRPGITIGELAKSLGDTGEAAKIVLGGPMTGMAQYDMEVPITADIPAVLFLGRQEITLSGDYRECINCGMCVKVCPVNLVPGVLSMYCSNDKFEKAESEGLLSCIECGCCDYVCPSRRPLVHLFRHAKHQLMEG